jgi:2-polyprenyl-3-methyl-5-hydroxy-6-metoxy-1,4-benzoquinol methylase
MSKYSENMPPKIEDAIGWMYGDISDGSTLLDFGCSTGYFGSYIKKNKNASVYGVEISDDRFEASKQLDGVYSFDIDSKWPEEVFERNYDYLFFGDVIEHLKDPVKALSQAKKLLKSDGKIFISTPNIAHISTRLELLQGNFEYESMGILDNTHLKYFTLSTLEKIAQESGFNIERVDCSTNDYPKEIVKKVLKKVGLTPEEKFWKLVDSREARTFQYKLVLSPKLNDKSEKSKFVAIPQKPQEFRDGVLAEYRKKEDILRKHAEEQAAIIAHYVEENNNLRKQLASSQSILGSLRKRLKI